MTSLKHTFVRMSAYFWLMLGMLLVFAITFVGYIRAEKQIDRANELRLQSFLLATELRQSSDDLTRMVRAYVVTGDSIYKQHYQEILDIRDGRKPRPLLPYDVYWDLVLADDRRPRAFGPMVSLLELMHGAGFTEEEFARLAEAKANSDVLTRSEIAAMELIESARPSAEANRAKAIRMLHDAAYHQAKARIMQPISQFSLLADRRTLANVHAAEDHATRMRWVFTLLGLLLAVLLWRVRRNMRAVLGASAQELYMSIASLGRGDFSTPIPVPKGMEDTVLGWLSETQVKLAQVDVARKVAHQELQASEARLQSIFDASPDALLISDERGKIIQANGQVELLLGYKVSELLGQSIEVLVPERYRASHPALRAQFSASPNARRLGYGREIKALRNDGSECDVEISLSQIRTAQGVLVAASLHDISEQKRTFEALRKGEERFRCLTEMSSDFYWETDVEHRFTPSNSVANPSVSPTWRTEVGQRRWELPCLSPDEAGWKAHRAVLDAHLSFRNFEISRLGDDGAVHFLSLSGDPIFDAGGNFTGYRGVGKDITDIKLAADNMRIAATAFESHEGMMITGADDIILRINHAFSENTGYTAEDIVGQPASILRSGRHAPAFFAAMWASIHRTGTWQGEVLGRRKNGEIYPKLLTITAVKSDEGAITHYVGIHTDITERKQGESRFIASEAKWRLLFENMTTGFALHEVICDQLGKVVDYRFMEINPAYEQITGLKASNLIGRTVLEVLPNTESYWIEIFGRVALTREPTLYEDYSKELGRWYQVRAFSPNIGQFAVIVSDITERKESEERIKSLAFYDPLTQLPNRRLLMDRLGQALASSARSGLSGAVLFVDLDNFKTLNDTLGHDKGDLLLQQVAERLATCVREGDTVARLGGDEFVVMLEDLSGNPEEAATQSESVGEKILATFNEPYLLAGRKHHSTPSIGVTLFSGHQRSIDELLQQADLAMYQSKAAGRNTLRFFDPKMQAIVTDRATLEVELLEAVREQQFILYYQPQVAGDGRLTGAEALVRWQHPARGLVPPGEFIALTEETGLILPLGNWVLKTACAQLAAWARMPETAHLSMAVNVSARQFHHKDFVDQVLAALDLAAANPKKLELELTESLLVSNVEDIIAKMTALKAKGVSFSLDDFGTGYSSLSHLKRLPLDQLKIDQGFVRDILIDPNDAAIARMIVALAESMGLTVIAEGVESAAQRDFLARQGCHAYQGYLFSPPLPADEFEAFVKRS